MRRRALLAVAAILGILALPAVAPAHVLRVGKWKGIRGQYKTIQAAVNHARPGDWILVAPGDYKEHSGRTPAGRSNEPAGVLITTPRIHIRGMNRNRVIVDGTKPHSRKCSRREQDQEFGPAPKTGGKPLGLNGFLIWKANKVWVQNLTVCNYLGGSGDAGNEVWWNGGDGSGRIGGWGFLGSYLSATSTFFKDESTAATYGIFSSNWTGGTWNRTYASNFNDSGYYIGACAQVCDQTINHAWSQWSALGYSGSNSGGQLVIKNSQFDHNEDGFDTNSQTGDNPPPQDGACPHNRISPITHTHSCWVFMHNYVHDNNNPNVPSAGSAAAGPVGTGMSVSGGRNDTIMHNRFERNNAWGAILIPYLSSGSPCTGGTPNALGAGSCLFDDWGNALIKNRFRHNGSYGHPSNGDIAWLDLEKGHPRNCFRGNTEEGGGSVRTSPSGLQQSYPKCDGQPAMNSNPTFFGELLCDSQFQISPGSPPSCPTGRYPTRTRVVMHPLPKHLRTMPQPCAGVPRNPWCPRKLHKKHKSARHRPTHGLF